MPRVSLYSTLKFAAIVLGLSFIAWAFYEQLIGRDPLDVAWEDAERLFEDGSYERAEAAFSAILEQRSDHLFALSGLARSRHRAGANEEALAAYNEVLALNPEQADALANRGILLDTMGRHEAALKDYAKALELDPELADGPSWMTRFLRNQAEAPPTIADRMDYLRAELAKPEVERVLRVPEIDEAQRPFRQ